MKNEIEKIKDLIQQAQERIAKLHEGRGYFKNGDLMTFDINNVAFIAISKNQNEHHIVVHKESKSIQFMKLSFHNEENYRSATPEEAQILFDALAKDGKRWNAEKKIIETIQPEFKAGDFVRVDTVDTDKEYIYVILTNELIENKSFQYAIAIKGVSGKIYISDTFGYYPRDKDTARHMTEAEKAEFLEMIKKAGYQYNPETNTCTKFRWRAEKYGGYWFANGEFKPISVVEDYCLVDDLRYNASNYFQTQAECHAFCDKVKELCDKVKELVK